MRRKTTNQTMPDPACPLQGQRIFSPVQRSTYIHGSFHSISLQYALQHTILAVQEATLHIQILGKRSPAKLVPLWTEFDTRSGRVKWFV